MPSHPEPALTEPQIRLLEAASRVFAAKGYDGASVRDIVGEAAMNVNAINYHFRTKQRLYAEVMRYQIALAESRHPGPSPADLRAKPREALRHAVEKFVAFMLDPDSLLPELYALELLHPSAIIRELKISGTYQSALRDCIVALLGEGATGKDIAQCQRAIYAQCAHYMLVRKVLPIMDPKFRYNARTVGDIAGQITEFSLGGIEQVRRRLRRAEGA